MGRIRPADERRTILGIVPEGAAETFGLYGEAKLRREDGITGRALSKIASLSEQEMERIMLEGVEKNPTFAVLLARDAIHSMSSKRLRKLLMSGVRGHSSIAQSVLDAEGTEPADDDPGDGPADDTAFNRL